MPSSLVYEHNFAQVTAACGARVEFAYDLDRERWPWLALAAHHPVLVEKYQYFSAVTSFSVAEPDRTPFAALTRFRWTCTEHAWRGGHATTGTCEPWMREDGLGFSLVVRDAEGRPVYRASGEGFEFGDRDFPAWRERNRRAVRAAGGAMEAELAPPSAVGVGAQGRSFVTRRHDAGGAPMVTALVPTRDGFHPHHPFHTGSGDHVNAGHLFDCVLQAAHLFHEGGLLECIGGAAHFTRFVELDVPFTITLRRREPAEDAGVRLEMGIAQAGRENALIVLDLRDAERARRLAPGGR
jgi:hypothetical protein